MADQQKSYLRSIQLKAWGITFNKFYFRFLQRFEAVAPKIVNQRLKISESEGSVRTEFADAV